jgi:hypothetical protein
MRSFIRACGLSAFLVVAAVPAWAQAVHSVQFGLGSVFPAGFDARSGSDVLLRNAIGEALPGDPLLTDALAFSMGDFNSLKVMGEWNVTFGDRIEFGAGLGYYRQTVPTVYYDLEDQNGFEIFQELSLRVVPVTGVVRFMPFGRAGQVQPYVGAGLAALTYRYIEAGDFVDGETLEIFTERYSVTGVTLGGILLGGVKLPINGDIYSLNIEGRYQFGSGDTNANLSDDQPQFLADKIDLSGGQLNFTFQIRF